MDKIKEWSKKYEQQIVLLVSLILVSAVAFLAGYWQGRGVENQPMVIEKASESPQKGPESLANPQMATNTTPKSKASSGGAESGEKKANCVFVASKNSDKFHAPNCQWAKRIKPENIVCYSSREEAQESGKKADVNCVK